MEHFHDYLEPDVPSACYFEPDERAPLDCECLLHGIFDTDVGHHCSELQKEGMGSPFVACFMLKYASTIFPLC
jgi:hypothetical protein